MEGGREGGKEGRGGREGGREEEAKIIIKNERRGQGNQGGVDRLKQELRGNKMSNISLRQIQSSHT